MASAKTLNIVLVEFRYHRYEKLTQYQSCQVTRAISGSHIDFHWGYLFLGMQHPLLTCDIETI